MPQSIMWAGTKAYTPLALRVREVATYQPTWGTGQMQKINNTSDYTVRP